MDAVTFVRGDIVWAHELFRMTVTDVTEEQAHWVPPGIANPIGATIAHAVCAKDAIVQVLIKGAEPLFATSWAERSGISEPSSTSDIEWARRVKVDLPDARKYTEAVFAQTEVYVDSLTNEELERVLDLN